MILDVLTQPLYDTLLVKGTSPHPFFSHPRGRGQSCFGDGPKTIADTNMDLASQLPVGYCFVVGGLYAEVVVPPSSPAALAGAVIELLIGTTVYQTLPLQRAALTLVVERDTAEATLKAALALKDVAAPLATSLLSTVPGVMLGFTLDRYPLTISQVTNFCCMLTPGAWFLRESAIVRLHLNGTLKRIPQ